MGRQIMVWNFARNLGSHFKGNKNFYDFLQQILTLVAVAVSIFSLAASRKAIEQTQQSLELQNKEFYVRNRPYLIIRDVKFAGPVTMTTGNNYPHSIYFSLSNLSPIPANSTLIDARIYINDREIRKTVFGTESLTSNVSQIAVAPNSDTGGSIGLTEKEHEEAQITGNFFSFRIKLQYVGILNTPEDEHQSTYAVYFDKSERIFKMTECHYQ